MSYDVKFAGESASGYISAGARTEKLCVPGQEWEVYLGFDCPLSIKPWTAVEIYENGTKVLTGYTASVSKIWDTEPRMVVAGIDTWKRATDCWNTEEYVTGEGDTVQSLIRRFLDMAGLSYQFNTDYDDSVPAGLSILYQPVSEIVLDLCSALGLFVRVNTDGWVIIGDVVSDGGTGDDLDNEIITFDMMESDYRARNRVIVWGPRNFAIVRSDEPWAVVDHTMVYASPYAYDAWSLANVMWSNLHTTEKVKTVEHPGDPDRKVGQRVDIDAPDDLYHEEDICTTLKADYSTEGYVMQSIFGERCAIFGHGPSPIDGRDIIVATYECGVWRCRDIWADTPHWEPLNIGLQDSNIAPGFGEQGSGFNCEWFIRDPFEPNTLAYLLNQAGIFKSTCLEPGYEEWTPVLYRESVLSTSYPLGTLYAADDWYISSIRSTVARQGTYYLAIQAHNFAGQGDRVFVGGTYNAFDSHFMGPDYTTIPLGPEGPAGRPPLKDDTSSFEWSDLWGTCNYGNQKVTAIGNWHGGGGGYIGQGGGLAAWHRSDAGCTITGVQSATASNGGPAHWDCIKYTAYEYLDPDSATEVLIAPAFSSAGAAANPGNQTGCNVPMGNWWCCYGIGGPLDPNCPAKNPTASGYRTTNSAESWLHIPSIHIPYDQEYVLDGLYKAPQIKYYTPGEWAGSNTETTDAWPTRNNKRLLLPWGSDPDLCHYLQGSIGTYSADRNKVYCFSKGAPSRFATSDDEGDSWVEKESVPFSTSCFSGFPRSSQKVYAGRDPVRDPTDLDDTSLIYVSWDRGETWHDVTGDLWDQTQALGKRIEDGSPLGTRGLVTIAPRYS